VVVVTIDGGVTGLDARTGARRWFLQRQLPALTLRAAAPPKAAGELVYWGTPSGRLLALDASNGAVLWENTVATPRGTSELERLIDVLGQPSLGNNRVCAAAYQGRIACFDAARGTLLWHRDISSLVGTLMDERFVYSVDEKGVAYALDLSTGATVWRRDVLAGRRASGLALLGERLAIQDMQGHVHVLDRANGRILARALGEGFESLAPLVA
ncbi:MAG: PQQ-binding-like beta-propeller repeat protein, partial [Geminicoccaceae bacterium]|nr:PQQ-binding-like beta-propeller repeat protein [Geminicoccaceae bacterium]